jgi:prepilin-type N-terminal cleavage/methylation domain-containing protein
MLQRSRPLSSRRPGFTLVELLVVILIIGILASLLTVGVSSALGKAKRTRNQVDIRQLALAVDAFKTKYKVEYIPSKLYLSESGATYSTMTGKGPISDSLAYLQRIWPRLTFPVDWNGSGKIETTGNPFSTIQNPNGEMILEGDQVLVFFLGGIPAFDPVTGAPSCTGFSKSLSNPAAHLAAGGAAADNPMFEFDSSRLVNLHPSSVRMLSYLDTYGVGDGKGTRVTGMPYLYFSSYGSRNGFNIYGTSDCAFFGVFPYAQGLNQYLNPTGFQIISAGADLKFGPGSANPNTAAGPFWSPATAGNSAASGPKGADDQSNFYESTLGTQSVN